MLELQPHSQRTSFATQLPLGLIRADGPPGYEADWEQCTVICSRVIQPTGTALPMFRPQTSVTGGAYSTNLVLSPPMIPLFRVSQPDVGCFAYTQRVHAVRQVVELQPPVQTGAFLAGHYSTFNQTVVFQPAVEGPSQVTCTVEGWTLPKVLEPPSHAGLSELRAVVRAIRETRPLASTPEFDDLLGRAARAHGTPDDIEEWARRLAEDVSGLAD